MTLKRRAEPKKRKIKPRAKPLRFRLARLLTYDEAVRQAVEKAAPRLTRAIHYDPKTGIATVVL